MRTAVLLVAALLLACGDDGAGPGPLDSSTANGGRHDAALPPLPEHDAGSDSGTLRATDVGSVGDLGASDVCSKCLGRECSAEATYCLEREACPSLIDCARRCSSADAGDCRVACLDAHRTGSTPYNELVLCIGQRCRVECPFATP